MASWSDDPTGRLVPFRAGTYGTCLGKDRPFDLRSFMKTTVQYERGEGGITSYRSVTTRSEAENDDHLSFSLSASAGGSLLGARAAGKYDKAVDNNRDSNKSSVQSSYRSGMIRLSSAPSLNMDAVVILKHEGGLMGFKRMYGDYYLAAYRLGGDVALMLSGEGFFDKTTETKAIEAKVKVLGFTTEYADSWSTNDEKQTISLQLLGHDTLDNIFTSQSLPDAGGRSKLAELANLFVARGENLSYRVESRLRELGIDKDVPLDFDICNQVTRAGAVAELLLTPVTHLRELQYWACDKNII